MRRRLIRKYTVFSVGKEVQVQEFVMCQAPLVHMDRDVNYHCKDRHFILIFNLIFDLCSVSFV